MSSDYRTVCKCAFTCYFEFFVSQSHALRWKDEEKMAKQCFNFLWNLFKEKYLPHAFADFDHSTSIYSPCLGNFLWLLVLAMNTQKQIKKLFG